MFFKLYLFVFCYLSVTFAAEWSYYDQASWSQINSCGGTRQSPINIDSSKAQPNGSLRLNLNNYNLFYRNLILNNNGHTAQITLDSNGPQPYISGSAVGTGNNYIFRNLHFHWGKSNENGSEHSLDGEFGAAELHFVHYNQKYGSFSNATNNADGIVVLSIIANLDRFNNLALDPLIRVLPQVRNYNSSAIIPYYNFAGLFPFDLLTFYRYSGSFTNPPCSEIVTFIVFEEPIFISPLQLSQFRLLAESKDNPNEKILFNSRSTQPLNGRVVQISRPSSFSASFNFDLNIG